MASIATTQGGGILSGRRGRILRENLTAYLYLTPAGLIIFTFAIFPVGFAFFVSLHRWQRFPEEFVGLSNYTRSLGNFAFVVFFWLGMAALVYAGVLFYRRWKDTRDEPNTRLLLIPAIFSTAAVLLFINWFAALLPVVMNTAQRVTGRERTTDLFIDEFLNSFRFPAVIDAGALMTLGILLALIISTGFVRRSRFQTGDALVHLARMMIPLLFLSAGVWLLLLTISEIQTAITAAQAEGAELPIWSQIILISLGFAVAGGAYLLWQRANKQDDDRRFLFMGLAALLLLVGGYILAGELPRVLGESHRNVRQGFSVTVMYSLGTVPIQLSLSLGLSYLLFQNIKGKSFFRIVYFLPYVMPFVATSVIFTLIFSQRTSSPANSLLGLLGIDPQRWVLEPKGVFELIFGPNIPEFLAGPGLALVVIMIWSTWIFTGYNTVIFLAGLGTIPGELYEAARIDGASGWKVFRHITLPLLSPTTFFLSLMAIIGTFQAFIQFWLMRTSASQRAVDTINIYIFQEINATRPNYAFGASMAFVLFAVILILTFFQNRIAGRRVFYG